MEIIQNMTKWITAIKVDEVKIGELAIDFVPSMRSIVSRFNTTRGRQKDIYIHMSYIFDRNAVVLICEPRHIYEENKSDINYAKEWKKKIPTHFD